MANGKLTVAEVKRLGEGYGTPGQKYRDGAGLFIIVGANGAARWVLRLKVNGRPRDMGLGAPPTVTLAMARELAQRHRRTAVMGGDPIAKRQAERVGLITFDEMAEQYIATKEGGWKNEKHRQQWRNTLATYASPKIGTTPMRDLATDDVLGVLRPIWTTKNETADRVRNRIELIWNAAKALGHCAGQNPGQWRGHLDALLPPKGRRNEEGELEREDRHHPAVIVDHAPTLYARLGRPARLGDGKAPGNAAMAVRFCLLTAARPGEVARARWPEIDRKAKVWTVPPLHQKSDKEHRVPLSGAALVILDEMDKRRDPASDYIFPGQKLGKSGTMLSLASLQKALRVAMGKDLKTRCGNPATTHGTARSTFDDWASERTSHPTKLIDRALAHGPKDATKAAYRRSELLEQRRPLMADWATFLSGSRDTA
jgi:integrase